GTGWRVTLYERRPAGPAEEVGAGIQMSPNACRCLAALGALEAVEAAAFAPRAAVLRDGRNGAVVYRAALREAAVARWGAPYLHVHRADLVQALAAAARARGVEIVPGTSINGAVAATEGEGEGIAALLDSGARVAGHLLVAADGLGSRLRTHHFGPAAPRFTGQTAWRATVPADRLGSVEIPPDATVWAAPGRHVVTYWLRGGSLANLVAVEEQTQWREEGWSHPGDPAMLRASFADFTAPVQALIAAAEAPLRWALLERPAPDRWSQAIGQGAVALIGDAVHPMLPFMAQGAAQALEDAVALARHLQTPDLGVALTAWEAERRPRTSRVQAVSRANGAMFHRHDGLQRRLSHALIGTVSTWAPGLAAGRLDWLYGHDAVAGP
ncbi:MAG: FAD-dependent monooxygenase, partial [Pseudomonadota bacterium]